MNLGRASRFAIAAILALGLTLAPPAARSSAAATGRLLVSSDATYTVDPTAAAVHVSVAASYRNDKPSDASFSYYWRDLSWSTHPEATNIQVGDSSGSLEVTEIARDGYIDARFRLRRDLLYGQTATLTLTWDLPGGPPRSESRVRVGQAFVAFDVWAWGDPGASSVTADLPAGFVAETEGSTVSQATGASGTTITAESIEDTTEFWVAVSALRESSLASDELTLPGDIALVVKSWPEDTTWRATVSTTLRLGLPQLQDLIGLPWPIHDRVEVSEIYTPLLEGYAGVFYTAEGRIELGEDLDDLTIVHEGSHAWFNDGLFVDRWIDEGLADTYAAVVLVALGKDRQSPDAPVADDPGTFDLSGWGAPGRITDETEDRELYGYNTSWFVINELYQEIGPEAMRAIFRAADGDITAYVGAEPPETVAGPDTWRRFLDLLDEVGGSTRADELFREYVITPDSTGELDARAAARETYAELVEAGGDWLPPIYVREPMGEWTFTLATDRMNEAAEILDLRDYVAAAADDLGLKPGPAFEMGYEGATAGFEDAEAIGEAELAALETLADASEAIAAPTDLVTSVGLLGVAPQATYDEARSEFQADRIADAELTAASAIELIDDAPSVGRARLLGAGIGVGLIVLFVLLGIAVRRRRRGGRAAALGSYATLAADSPAPPPPPVGDAGPEGGTADGEGPSAAI
jgi:hypothetical protein